MRSTLVRLPTGDREGSPSSARGRSSETRTATLERPEIDGITANRWELGSVERPAWDILKFIVDVCRRPRPTLPAYAAGARWYPDATNFDLFRRLIGRPWYDLRSLGWSGL
jgi:hypothetical protein